ncbi:unnamed protein product [Paramecium primaurelia]|uniref:Adiponectin receptor protein n=1 Tax=Paramecium primaurelia TaxID=5886 RepID=A0A8S1QKF7_PARPR|nr:unnamed protein product [Paramecium primaurelia]
MSQNKITNRVPTENQQATKENKDNIIHERIIGPICKAPGYLKDQYIKHGYRINFKNKKDVIKSMFMWHNELVNIWTHLIGAIIIVSLIFYLWLNYDELFRHRAIQSFNESLHNIYEHAFTLEQQIQEQLENGLHHFQDDVQLMQQQLHEKIYTVNKYFNEVAHQYDQEFSKIQKNIAEAFDWENLKWNYNISEIIQDYKQKATEIVESKDFDWIDLYLEFQHLTGRQTIDEEKLHKMISRWPLIAFLVSAIICLGCSTTYHLFYCLSENVNKVLIRLDYAGICFLVSGSTFAPLFYGFQCNLKYAIIYASLQGFFAIILFSFCLFDFFYTAEWRSLKNKLFAGLGFTSAIPLIHFAIGDSCLEGYSFESQLPYYAAMAISYLSGLYIYNIRFPEKQIPGKFDNCGQSHQIWHISVVIAILFTYVGSLNAYYQRLDMPCKA